MIAIRKECDVDDLKQELWSGGLDTLKEIIENDKVINKLFFLSNKVIVKRSGKA